MNFREITIEDKAFIDQAFKSSGNMSYPACFGTYYLWPYYFSGITEINGCFIAEMHSDAAEPIYTFPAGADPEAALLAFVSQIDSAGGSLRLFVPGDTEKCLIEKILPGRFKFKELLGDSSYIYLIDDLAEMPGGKFQEIRRKINRVMRDHPDYGVEAVTPDNIDECEALAASWQLERRSASSSEISEIHEENALKRCFDSFEELGMIGLLVRIGGRIVSFDIGEIMPCGNCLDLHFEKASYDIPDLYPLQRRLFAKYLKENFPEIKYINYENDMDIPGLRRWKQQWNPCMMWPCYSAYSTSASLVDI